MKYSRKCTRAKPDLRHSPPHPHGNSRSNLVHQITTLQSSCGLNAVRGGFHSILLLQTGDCWNCRLPRY